MKRKHMLFTLPMVLLIILFMPNIVQQLDQSISFISTDSLPSEDTHEPSGEIPAISGQSGRSSMKPDSLNEKRTANPSKAPVKEKGENIETFSSPMTVKELDKLPSGTIIDIEGTGDTIMESCFYFEEINEDIKFRINGKSYKEDCTTPYEDLRYVRVLYFGFDKETHIGELIVNKAIASDIINIFKELYQEEYPIEQMVLVDDFNADDNASIAANNTSSFNYRSVPGSTHLSRHALGLAIDINPLYNPYVRYTDKGTTILPAEGTKYADRTLDCPYYINENDLCYQAFTKRGFTWGGFWKTEQDYQHFQITLD